MGLLMRRRTLFKFLGVLALFPFGGCEKAKEPKFWDGYMTSSVYEDDYVHCVTIYGMNSKGEMGTEKIYLSGTTSIQTKHSYPLMPRVDFCEEE